ncbi:hypothetical protein M758_10G143700 [Ceratodon purpureus]|nr:hypothetical protein M758_10G143700 [Ceratodon purpureus]
MHLPISHLSGFEEDASEELQAQLQGAQSGSQDDEGSHNSQSQGSGKEGSKEGGSGDGAGGGDGAVGGRPPKDLPCPRCQSMNTKFCYYNNYSVNQPRHFCRNCQRYWTVGGTLRNVPVGGGSRKKSSRSRARSDPYYRPNAPATGSEEGQDDDQRDPRHGQHPAMARPMHPDGAFGDAGFPDFPMHPSQISSFLQFALHGQATHGLGLQFPPFLDPPGFAMTPEEEAELQAFYEATTQSGMMTTAAAMMGSGLWVPELEPAHVALMQKAALWAEAQRIQSMARRAQAAAWADQERECKPVVSPPILQQRAPMEEAGQRQQAAASLHRRPGFWETALMHSRPSRRPAGSSQRSSPWDEAKPEGDNSQNNIVAEEGTYSQAGYDVESSTWAPSTALNSSNPEMFY